MLTFLEFLAVISAACFGILLARSKRMDAIGVFAVAFLLAFGGGTLRDVLLDRRPLFWVAHEEYTWTVFGLALAGAALPRLPRRLEYWLNLPDALGLGFFSVVGVGVAIQSGMSPFISSLFGVITGTSGGVLGDIVCNEVPRLFQPTATLYASCSFVGCWVYLLLRQTAATEPVALWSAVAFIVLTRVAAVRWKLHIPAAPA